MAPLRESTLKTREAGMLLSLQRNYAHENIDPASLRSLAKKCVNIFARKRALPREEVSANFSGYALVKDRELLYGINKYVVEIYADFNQPGEVEFCVKIFTPPPVREQKKKVLKKAPEGEKIFSIFFTVSHHPRYAQAFVA